MTNHILAIIIAAAVLPFIPSQPSGKATGVIKKTDVLAAITVAKDKPVDVVQKPVEAPEPKEEPKQPVTPPAPKPAVVAAPVAPQPAPVASPTEAEAKAFIYMKESGNNPLAVNRSSGACGLGQSLPCAKVLSSCPDMNYQCQDAWFTNYMQSRYGTWAKAMAFWQIHRWW